MLYDGFLYCVDLRVLELDTKRQYMANKAVFIYIELQ
jgi:hypothetical protein